MAKKGESRAERRRAEALRPMPARDRTNAVLGAGLVAYLAILATMVAFDSYTFVLKSAVIPFLLAAAVLSQRFGGFVNDWAIFLGVVVWYDALRSAVYAVITHFQLPMYAVYAIDWERALCGGAIAPVVAQQWRAALGEPLWLDRFFVLLHASHFLVFLLFGFVLWMLRREAFRTYAAAMVAVLFLGLAVQLAVPTLPPWLAARDFGLLPPMPRLIDSVYNVHLPSLAKMFDINPIAAMPSLHAAMPVLCAAVALHYLGRRGLVVAAYAAGVCLAVVYLGEHYLVDVLAGIALSLAVYAGVRRWGEPATSLAAPNGISAERLALRPIAAAVALVLLAFGCGQLASAWLAPLPITRAFVERELVGRSPSAHYLLGRIALEEGDAEEARVQLTRALADLPGAEEQKVVRSFLEQAVRQAGELGAAATRLPALGAQPASP